MDPGAIHCVECDSISESLALLPDEIAGLSIMFHRVKGELVLPSLSQHHRILFLVEGAGTVQSGEWSRDVDGLTVAIPSYRAMVSVKCGVGSAMAILELQWAMGSGDADGLARAEAQLPYLLRYSNAKPYSEAIKSPQTVSRTLVPTGVIPRFAAGSVQTRGPDAVGEHSHPMLEQLFLGLPGNECLVSADGRSTTSWQWNPPSHPPWFDAWCDCSGGS